MGVGRSCSDIVRRACSSDFTPSLLAILGWGGQTEGEALKKHTFMVNHSIAHGPYLHDGLYHLQSISTSPDFSKQLPCRRDMEPQSHVPGSLVSWGWSQNQHPTRTRELVVLVCSVVSDSATPGTIAHQAPLSMGFPRQEYWSRLPFPSPGDLSNPGIEPASPALAGGFFTTEPPGELFTG